MAKQNYRVVSTNEQYIFIKTQNNHACLSCKNRKICQLLDKKYNTISLEKRQYNLDLKKNDNITISIPGTWLIKTSFLVYSIPLLCIMASLFLGNLFLTTNDFLNLILIIIGIISSFFITKKIRKSTHISPPISIKKYI